MSSAIDTMESRSVTTGAGKSKASLRFHTDSSPAHHGGEAEEFEHSAPVVIQRLPPVRQTYSYPGSVANPSTYDKFRFLTEETMSRALHEAKKTMEEERYRRICGKKKMRAAADDSGGDNSLCADISRSCYEKWVKQIKWFWFEIEDYLREIETVYNEVRLHADNFMNRKKDKEEEARRQRRVNEFTARSCRIVYDLQQQIRDVFNALDSNSNVLSRVVMKKIHSIHRGAVIALQNLLTRLPDFELDRGLPPAYHQLAMLIRRLAQCCYQLKFGQEVNIIRTLEGIRQKVESATTTSPELPLYRMTPPSKRPLTSPADVWSGPNKPTKTCPVVWQEFDFHSKGKRPPKEVPSKIMEMIDISSHQGYIAPVHLQQGIDRFLRIKSPNKEGKRPGAATSKLMAALKGQAGTRDEEFDSISRRLKLLQQEFITEVEGEISARLKPLLQEAKKVSNAHGKRGKTVNISHVQVEHPRDPLARQKSKVRNVLGFLNKVDSELQIKDQKRMAGEGFDINEMTEKLTMGSNKPRRARSPVTMRQPRAARATAAVQQASNERLSRPKTASLKTNPLRTTITRRTSSAQAPSSKPALNTMTPGGDASIDMWKTLKGASKMAKLAVTKMPMKSLLSEKEQMVYQMHERTNETIVEDEEGNITRGLRVAAGGGGGGVGGGAGQEDLQWALQGSLSLWNPNQVDEMLGKLKDMEDDENTIRQRWQDLLLLDPSLTGASSNYRIAYGESKEFADNKEPDAIVLMKPSKKDDTLVVVTSLPSRGGDEGSAEGVREEGEEGDRARAGKDPFAFNGTRLYYSIPYLNAVEKYCQNFDTYLRRTSHYSVGDFDPWRVVEDVADDILVDLFGNVAVEIVDIPEACVKEMYEAEFAQA